MSHAAAAPVAVQITITTAPTGALQVTTVQTDAERTTLQIQGEIDLANAELLTGVLENQLAVQQRHVRLDMSRLTFLDCTGLRVIVDAHNKFLVAGGKLVLTGIGCRIARLLDITRLDETLFIADDFLDSDHPPADGFTSR
jgi:anti-sigma B factor antagonist